ncbi:MAG: hypothetical protein K9M36_00255 [Candidatus Pacebacteria bacterium]|nr:hypothetical protein [Candidatus Paceibacterota bacterium]
METSFIRECKVWFAGLSRRQKIIQSFCFMFFCLFFLVLVISLIQSHGHREICNEMNGYYKGATTGGRKIQTPMGCYLSKENYEKNKVEIDKITENSALNFYMRPASWINTQLNWYKPSYMCSSISSLFGGEGGFCKRL